MVIEFGRALRWYNDYDNEIEFSKQNGFGFMQIWFSKEKLLINNIEEPIEAYLKARNFPLVIHAVFEPDDFVVHDDILIEILKYLGHSEVIIHPVSSQSKEISDTANRDLSENIKRINAKFKDNGIVLYVENNSRLDKLNYTIDDLSLFFAANPDVELCLDIAHIDSYEHLQDIIKVKYPRMLHISDKRFSVEHEHLPIGMGDLDFELIFSKYLRDFNGKIILEIPEEDDVIIDSMAKIQRHTSAL